MIRRFAPELNTLKNFTKRKLEENISHAYDVIKSEKPATKVIGQEIGKMVAKGPETLMNDLKEVSAPIRSIAEKTVEILSEQKDPISKEICEIIKNKPNINPVNIVDNAETAIKTYSENISKNMDDIGVEITKTVVEEKIKTKAKQKFFDKILSFFNKIKMLFSFKRHNS